MTFQYQCVRLFAAIILCLGCVIARSATLDSVSVRQEGAKTSLFVSLSQPVKYRVFSLVNPNRIVVDFENTRLLNPLKQWPIDNRYIKKIRTGQLNPHTLRLVLEVSQSMTTQANDWLPRRSHHALRLDLATGAPTQAKSQGPVLAKHAPRQRLRLITVVLDPGHGGKDPGAKGPSRTQEKEVVLNIARKLKAKIDAEPGMRAVLTRDKDIYIGLRERLNIARQHNADVFVSIHADAFNNPRSSGASVFALSQRGATSEAARWLAEKENYSELGGVNLSELDDKNGVVRTVLIDLSQTATISASLHIGERLLQELGGIAHLHNNHVEQARFVVLKSPDIPSVLVETGFISNPREERNLRSAFYQNKLANAVFKGLKQYFWEYPPQGTLVEQKIFMQKTRYKRRV